GAARRPLVPGHAPGRPEGARRRDDRAPERGRGHDMRGAARRVLCHAASAPAGRPHRRRLRPRAAARHGHPLRLRLRLRVRADGWLLPRGLPRAAVRSVGHLRRPRALRLGLPGRPRRVVSPAASRGERRLTGAPAAALAYGVLAVAYTWPLATRLKSAVPWDLGDSLLNDWILAWHYRQAGLVLSGAWSE